MSKKEMLKSILLKQERLTTQLMEIYAMIKSFNSTKEVDILDLNKELVVGKWYKYPDISNWIVCVNEFNNSFIRGYGFNNKSVWMSKGKWMFVEDNLHLLVEATPQEVESALIEEAKMRYKVGDNVKSLVAWGESGDLDFKEVSYFHNDNDLWISSKNCSIKVFDNGKWASDRNRQIS